ncbi:MAG: phosphotransferase, partial [Desulfobacula sp.]|nr:phosphotransferase [Desulfobacula sp.]
MADVPSDHKEQIIAQLLDISYDISGRITRLAGENENYLVKTKKGTRYVLKLADEDTTAGMVEIEHLAVERLIDDGLGTQFNIRLPRVIETRTGEVQACLMTRDRKEIRGRLLEFVNGTAWCEQLPSNTNRRVRLGHLGKIIAQINLAMAHIIHPATQRTHSWDLAKADQHRADISSINNSGQRQILEWIFHLYAAIAKPLFASLPHSLIHGDIN